MSLDKRMMRGARSRYGNPLSARSGTGQANDDIGEHMYEGFDFPMTDAEHNYLVGAMATSKSNRDTATADIAAVKLPGKFDMNGQRKKATKGWTKVSLVNWTDKDMQQWVNAYDLHDNSGKSRKEQWYDMMGKNPVRDTFYIPQSSASDLGNKLSPLNVVDYGNGYMNISVKGRVGEQILPALNGMKKTVNENLDQSLLTAEKKWNSQVSDAHGEVDTAKKTIADAEASERVDLDMMGKNHKDYLKRANRTAGAVMGV